MTDNAVGFWLILSVLVLHFFQPLNPEDFSGRNYDNPISLYDVAFREARGESLFLYLTDCNN